MGITARACDKLRSLAVDETLLRTPVSISVHAARVQGVTDAAMTRAEFDRLYAALHTLAGPALAYKSRKPAEMLLHHLEENVAGSLQADILPRLQGLVDAVKKGRPGLAQRKGRMLNSVWRSVVPILPDVLEKTRRNAQRQSSMPKGIAMHD